MNDFHADTVVTQKESHLSWHFCITQQLSLFFLTALSHYICITRALHVFHTNSVRQEGTRTSVIW